MPPAVPPSSAPRSPFSLHSCRALVTGAGRGLGFEIARALAQAGAAVWLNGRDAAALQAAADALNRDAPPHPAQALAFDITDPAATDAAFGTLAAHGGVQILVNNVGLRDRRLLDAFALGEVRTCSTPTSSPLRRSCAARQMMGPGGRIVNITSIAGPISRGGDAVYTMAKGVG